MSTLFSQNVFGKSWDDLCKMLRPEAPEMKIFEECLSKVKQAVKDIGEAFISGSVGKGTNVAKLQAKVDLDIVVLIRDMTPKSHPQQIDRLDKAIKASKSFANIKTIATSVQFQYTESKDCVIDVDLLPAAPLPEGPAAFFLNLPTQGDRDLMSASSSKLQSSFIESQSDLYKDLVRVAKYWRSQAVPLNTKWDNGSYPSSCLLEYFMLQAYQLYSSTYRPSSIASSESKVTAAAQGSASSPLDKRDVIFRSFLELISRADRNTFLCWNTHYDESAVKYFMQDDQGSKALLPNGPNPIVMDVANPTNNVANRITNWQPLRQYAQRTLRKTTEADVSSLQLKVAEQQAEIETLKKSYEQSSAEALKRHAALTAVMFAPRTGTVLVSLAALRKTPPAPVTEEIRIAGLPFSVTCEIEKDAVTVSLALQVEHQAFRQLKAENNIALTVAVVCQPMYRYYQNDLSKYGAESKATLKITPASPSWYASKELMRSYDLREDRGMSVQVTCTLQP